MINPIYNSIETSKSGSLIPVLFNGKTIESRYNPEREAENILKGIEKKYDFFILIGIGSGILLSQLLSKFPTSKIICVERTDSDISFLNQFQPVKLLQKNPNVIFTNFENLSQIILNNYLPAKHGDIKIIEQRAWVIENQDIYSQLKKNIEHSIRIISADYSVQSHFGKIWQNNIFNNLKLLSKCNFSDYNIDSKKNAYVVAAGPSLDYTIKQILSDNSPFIISTDTAYSTLLQQNIIPDIVISIDGQNVSYNHYLKSKISQKTLFMFDLSANNSAAKKIFNKNGKLLFYKSGHPLSELANSLSDSNIFSLYSGSGTITIAAVDLSIKLGFKNIFILGADFSYSDGKAYTKGTYLDGLYNLKSYKCLSSEYQFNKLMFRTELINTETPKKLTTEILEAYKYSLHDFLKQNNIEFILENGIYILKNNNSKSIKLINNNFSYSDFIEKIKKLSLNQLELPLLPFIAFLRHQNHLKNYTYDDLLKLAHSIIVSYN